MTTATILVVEDDREMRALLEDILVAEGYQVRAAADGAEGFKLFLRHEVDLIITDVMMPGMKGTELLNEVQARRPDVPVIIITAFGNIESAVDAMKGGAYHYLPKPFRTQELLIAVSAALRERHLLQELASLRAQFSQGPLDMIAESPAMRRVLDVITRAAAADTAVLLTGESGTGKEVLARVLHARSPRLGHPFLAINCAAIPETLLESQLFGHRRGAFTDARQDRMGLFQEAEGGTVFLDEIGDMPLGLQAKILRVLQEKEVHPLGAPAPIAVDVRIVASTNRDLAALMREGKFREDLYYRLNVISVRVPPLRERPDDLLPLIAHFLEKHGRRLGREGCKLSTEALQLLQRHAWPGNVRELENAIERALVLSRQGTIGPADLPEGLGCAPASPAVEEMPRSVADIERDHILRVLHSVAGNKTAAARLLGLDRKTLYRKLQSYGLGSEADDSTGPKMPQP
ncbi:MAG: sigma-54-dependent Fis family transcriptional regulator [Candidatus Eisenbacteria bacterium]|nr:sigma-54-dependent Fis family transcriptional regulator [Candidatus Eisenbacteria bacterium]